MDINHVKFGSYTIGGYKNQKSDNKETKENANVDVKTNLTSEKSADGVMNALNIAGAQNMAFVSVANKKEVNPADYLSADRVADIEASMANFELGVSQFMAVLEDEFPGMLSDERKMSLAASIFEQQA